MKKKKKYTLQSKREIANRLKAIQDVAVDLLKARDPHHLLDLMVRKAMDLLSCDGGSLYLKGDAQYLMFEICKNDSINFDFRKEMIPLRSKGIATECFNNDEVIVLDDVYHSSGSKVQGFNSHFDTMVGYRTKSIIACPLKDSQGEKLGVIQLLNKKTSSEVSWPIDDEEEIKKMPSFTQEDQDLLVSFASLASASLENSNLHKEIENLLEGFVKASVQAIETRDFATCGHSERVALLTTELADVVGKSSDNNVKNVEFTRQQMKELRYAALLHDFGKIGVREKVLLKAEKLFPIQKLTIEARFKEFGHVGEIHLLRRLLDDLVTDGRAPNELDMARVQKEIQKFRGELKGHWDNLLRLNNTSVMDKDNSQLLENFANMRFKMLDGTEKNLLEEEEFLQLTIKRGSLSTEERDEINRHVSYTYQFLKNIPWTRDLKNLADIAHAHHEKIDGTGYPRGLKGSEIPIQARIMTVADIFDALVASDRPYKKSLSFEEALGILELEAKDNKIEKFLVEMFIEAKVYNNVQFLEVMKKTRRSAA